MCKLGFWEHFMGRTMSEYAPAPDRRSTGIILTFAPCKLLSFNNRKIVVFSLGFFRKCPKEVDRGAILSNSQGYKSLYCGGLVSRQVRETIQAPGGQDCLIQKDTVNSFRSWTKDVGQSVVTFSQKTGPIGA